MATAASAMKVGDPNEEGVVVGPIISEAQLGRIEGYVKKGVEEGATIACGGQAAGAHEGGILLRAPRSSRMRTTT